MKKLHAAALFAAAAALTACASSDQKAARKANPAPCPNILVLNDAARVIEFDGAETADNIAYTGEIVNVSSNCRYFTDKPIDAQVSIDLAFGKGPKASSDEKVFTYFVAVTRRNSDLIAKEEFHVPVKFDGERPVETARVDIDKIIIPRANDGISGVNFEIVVGFAVTPKQAIYNRSGKSLKFPDLK